MISGQSKYDLVMIYNYCHKMVDIMRRSRWRPSYLENVQNLRELFGQIFVHPLLFLENEKYSTPFSENLDASWINSKTYKSHLDL